MAEHQNTCKTPPPLTGANLSTDYDWRTIRVPQVREYVAEEMKNEIICCPLDDWFDAYRTFEPTEAELAACMTVLKGGVQMREGRTASRSDSLLKGNKFVKFPTPPSKAQEPENDVFKPLKDIAERLGSVDLDKVSNTTKDGLDGACAVGGAAASSTSAVSKTGSEKCRRLPNVHWRYDSKPNSAIPGEQAGSTNRVDGYFHCNPQQGALSLTDVAVICEYKKKGGDAVQNRKQLVGAAAHILNEDPIRFAVYGITIEDCNASLWYFCRSHTAKSFPFNFLTDPFTLVKVFVSFMFAPSESLGFDSNIRRIMPSPRDGHPSISYVYRLIIEDNGAEYVHYYRTRRTICDSHRLCITGRARRVWEVEQVKSFDDLTRVDNKVVVLREVWLDEGVATERQTQQAIFSSLDTFGDKLKEDPTYSPPHFSQFDDDLKREVRALFEEEDSLPPSGPGAKGHRKAYEKYFLTIREDSVGQATRAVAKNFEPSPMLMRAAHPMRIPKSSTVPGADPSRNNQNSATIHIDRSQVPKPPHENTLPRARRYRPKHPHRLIYEEIGLDLDDERISSLKDIFTGLQGCFTASLLLFCAGWVHRDISCGNVLIWTDPEGKKQGKLGDLEYAKPFPSEGGSPDPKTGTAYFMPVEIAKGCRMAPTTGDTANTKRPRIGRALTPPEGEMEMMGSPKKRNGSQDKPPSQREAELVRHDSTHEAECLWWLTLWSVTARLGKWNTVETVFTSSTARVATKLREMFLMYDNCDLPALAEELRDSLQTVHGCLMNSRAYLRSRFLELSELDERARADPAEHSGAFMVLRQLVNVQIPSDAPPLVNGSNPCWWFVESEGGPRTIKDTTAKRPRPVS